MNRYVEKLREVLDSDIAELTIDLVDFTIPFAMAVGSLFYLFTAPLSTFWWLLLIGAVYFGERSLEDLVEYFTDEEIPFGEEIYHEDED